MNQMILQAARSLAKTHRENEPNIREIYLFPAENEVRLIEVDSSAIPHEERIIAFYFKADPRRGYPFPSGIAMITPDETGRIPPPEDWGNWDDAIRIWPEHGS